VKEDKMRIGLLLLVFSSAAISSCGYHPLSEGGDSPQKLWCGERLCDWSVEEGQAQPMASWHALDPAIRLKGAMARITRLDTLGFTGAACLAYSVYSLIQGNFSLRLDVDLGGDGKIERAKEIRGPRSDAPAFAPLEIPGEVADGGLVRASLTKEGSDDAAIYPLHLSFRPCPADRPDVP
jgi:hypothetical protein